MPAYNDDSDLLSDEGPGAPTAETQENSAAGKDGQTALVPTSFCPGMKPGDEITATIEQVQDGQYLLKYESAGGEEGMGEGAPEAQPEMGGDSEMAGMME